MGFRNSEEQKNFLTNGYSQELANFLPAQNVSRSSLVCSQWNQFFNQEIIWKNLIERDLGITKSQLALISLDQQVNFKKLYIVLHQLTQKFDKKSIKSKPHLKDISYLLHDKKRFSLLMACCLQNADQVLPLIPQEEYALWFKFCIHTGFDHIAKAIYNAAKYDIYQLERMYYLNQTALAGKCELAIEQLQEVLYDIQLKPTIITLDNALLSKNIELILYLLDPKNQFNITPTDETLRHASAVSKEIFDKIEQTYPLTPNLADGYRLDKVIKIAAQNGHTTIVKDLLTREGAGNKRKIKIRPPFEEAFESGNRELIDYLLPLIINHYNEPRTAAPCLISTLETKHCLKAGDGKLTLEYLQSKKIHLHPDTLIYAAESGNIDLVKDFLDLNLTPNLKALSAAIRSGNLELVKYLLQEKFQLEKDPTFIDLQMSSLIEGVKTGNLQLVDFLHQKFKFKPNGLWQNIILDAAKTGSVELVDYLLCIYPLVDIPKHVSVWALQYAAKSGSINLVEYLLNNCSWLQIDTSLVQIGLNSKSLAMMEYLLDPKKSYQICVPENKLECIQNSPTLKNLLVCDRSFKQAIKGITTVDPEVIQDLTRAYHAMPSHFFRLTNYLFHKLIDEDMPLLQKVMYFIHKTLAPLGDKITSKAQWESLFIQIGAKIDVKNREAKHHFEKSRMLLFAGHMKNKPSDTPLARLPKDIVKEIASYLHEEDFSPFRAKAK